MQPGTTGVKQEVGSLSDEALELYSKNKLSKHPIYSQDEESWVKRPWSYRIWTVGKIIGSTVSS